MENFIQKQPLGPLQHYVHWRLLQWGLTLYIQEKLGQNNHFCYDPVERSHLDYIMEQNPYWDLNTHDRLDMGLMTRPHLGIATTHVCQPNQKYLGTSP